MGRPFKHIFFISVVYSLFVTGTSNACSLPVGAPWPCKDGGHLDSKCQCYMPGVHTSDSRPDPRAQLLNDKTNTPPSMTVIQREEVLLRNLKTITDDFSKFRISDFIRFIKDYKWNFQSLIKVYRIFAGQVVIFGDSPRPEELDPEAIRILFKNKIPIEKADPKKSCLPLRQSQIPVTLRIGKTGDVLEALLAEYQYAQFNLEIFNCSFEELTKDGEKVQYLIDWEGGS